MYLFAQALDQGRGVKTDAEGALRWYTRAADAGIVAAQYTLGAVYEQGRLGARADTDRALEWYRKAAARKYGDAVKKVRALSR
jgi:TPR repeat protein